MERCKARIKSCGHPCVQAGVGSPYKFWWNLNKEEAWNSAALDSGGVEELGFDRRKRVNDEE